MTSQTRPDSLTRFLDHLAQSLPDDGSRTGFLKLTLSGPVAEGPELPRRLDWKLVILKAGLALSCVFHYPRRDETKNYSVTDAVEMIKLFLGKDFRCADLQTASGLHSLRFDRKGAPHLVSKRLGTGSGQAIPAPASPALAHDRRKERLLDPDAPWLRLLGVTDESGIIPRMQDKFRQIDRFVRVIDDLVEESGLLKVEGSQDRIKNDTIPTGSPSGTTTPLRPLQVVDMGSGKAYLTFATHAHLSSRLPVCTTGVEIRPDLAESSNTSAARSGFAPAAPGQPGLTFQQGTIQDWLPPNQRSEAAPPDSKEQERTRRRLEDKEEAEASSGACQVAGASSNQRLRPAHSAREQRSEADDAVFKDAQGRMGAQQIGDLRPAPGPVDVLVGLHACDTATDDALLAGLASGARIMVCSPCCHKQVRKDMKAPSPAALMTRFGILEERLAEMVTDSVRALVLEAFGYKVKVFEFISAEHTGKNLMITAVRSARPAIKAGAGTATGTTPERTASQGHSDLPCPPSLPCQPTLPPLVRPEKLAQARQLMSAYGVSRHYLVEKIGDPVQNCS